MTEQDGLPFPQRYWAILTIALGIVMAVMDGAIANVALPTIAQDLHASPSFSIWIVNGYQLAITISLLPLASLGEIIGYRRVYLAGLLAVHGRLALLRAVAHAGAAHHGARDAGLRRGRDHERECGAGALHLSTRDNWAAASASMRWWWRCRRRSGPTLAAGILAVGTWPWLFAVNIPFGIAAWLIGRALPAAHAQAPHAFDWRGALLSAVAFGLGIAAIDSVGHGERPLCCTVANSSSRPSPA